MVSRAALVSIALAACGSHARRAAPPANAAAEHEITLYRDRALVKQHVDVEIPPADTATITVRLPIGVDVEDIVVLDRGELRVSELAAVAPAGAEVTEKKKPPPPEDEDEPAEEDEPAAPPPPTTPTEVSFVVSGPHAGHFGLSLGFVTDRITWDAAYTLTTTPARERVTLRGAIAIRNATGLGYAHARTYVVDTELGTSRDRIAELFGAELADTPTAAPITPPRLLGTLALGAGETRVELLPAAAPREMRSVLVYDPIGTKLDHGGVAPIRDPALGVVPAASPRVTESFEVPRDRTASLGLPGGPVRLLERQSDGSLAVLGETRLFDAATRNADVDTVAIGTATGVVGSRERREMTIDDDGKRLVEEFVLTVKNERALPVQVVLREHLYRGQNWTLAYRSAPQADKEGPQQISMRTTVPAHGSTKVLYVAVYTWEPAPK